MSPRSPYLAAAVAALLSGANLTAHAAAGDISRLSHDYSTSTQPGNNHAFANPSGSHFSSDGRYVVFESYASNLVASDSNGVYDVFLYDTQTHSLTNITRTGNGHSQQPSISANGRYITFTSGADNLVDNDTNSNHDIFVYDRQTATFERVSVTNAGAQGSGEHCYAPSISDDGRYVAFHSYMANLVSGDTNGQGDVFVHDRTNHTTERVSVDSDGAQGTFEAKNAAISGDGRYVAFETASHLSANDPDGNIPDIFVHDRQTHTTEKVSVNNTNTQGTRSESYAPAISNNGRYVAFRGYGNQLVSDDSNGVGDIFVHDRTNHTTERVSLSSSGVQANGESYYPTISADGRYVAFMSTATNLVSNDNNGFYDVFVYDRQNDTVMRLSTDAAGNQGNNYSTYPAISLDGSLALFSSWASNLVSGGQDSGHWQLYLKETGLTPSGLNHAPVARAGADRNVEANRTGGAALSLNGTGSSDADNDTLSYTWSGACGTASGATPSVTCPLGSNTVTLTVRDPSNESSSDDLVITVEDTTAPTLHLPTPEAEATSASGATVNFSATATDTADSSVAVTCVPSSGSTFPIGSTSVTCSAQDDSGNGVSNEMSVTVQDTTAPTVTAPSNKTKEATGSTTSVSLGSASATDLVDGSLSATPSTSGPFPVGVTTLTWSATDSHHNTGTATQTVTVTDTTAPTLTVPANISTYAIGKRTMRATVSYSASATDLVDGSVSTSCTPASDSQFSLGVTTVTCSASDSRHNSASRQFTVTVLRDSEAPRITPAHTYMQIEASGLRTPVDLGTPVVTDNFDTAATGLSASATPTGPFEIGTTLVNWFSKDRSENVGHATTLVEVRDTVSPHIACPGNVKGTVGQPVNFGAPQVRDVVDPQPRVSNNAPRNQQYKRAGTYKVIWTAQDFSGNQSRCAQTITVR